MPSPIILMIRRKSVDWFEKYILCWQLQNCNVYSGFSFINKTFTSTFFKDVQINISSDCLNNLNLCSSYIQQTYLISNVYDLHHNISYSFWIVIIVLLVIGLWISSSVYIETITHCVLIQEKKIIDIQLGKCKKITSFYGYYVFCSVYTFINHTNKQNIQGVLMIIFLRRHECRARASVCVRRRVWRHNAPL